MNSKGISTGKYFQIGWYSELFVGYWHTYCGYWGIINKFAKGIKMILESKLCSVIFGQNKNELFHVCPLIFTSLQS